MKIRPADMHEGVITCEAENTAIQLIPGAYYSVSLSGAATDATAYEIQYKTSEDATGVTYDVDDSTQTTKLFGILTPPSGWVNVKLTDSVGIENFLFGYTKIAQ